MTKTNPQRIRNLAATVAVLAAAGLNNPACAAGPTASKTSLVETEATAATAAPPPAPPQRLFCPRGASRQPSSSWMASAPRTR